MFIILTYDVGKKRNAKVMKICRKYLNHEQKSVFEGTITEAKLNRLKGELKAVINVSEDKVNIYRFESLKYSSKEIIGQSARQTNII